MHEVLAPVGRFCRGLERIFLHPVQCNIYLTPAGAQGFRAHYDAHDVLVLQVQGQKLWRWWEAPYAPFANPATRWNGAASPPKPDDEPVSRLLRPGEAIYMPRGVMHEAPAQGGEASLHLTIGLLGYSWADVLRRALNALETQAEPLRQAFPSWRLAEGALPDDLVGAAAERLALVGSHAGLEVMAQQLLASLARSQAPMLGRGLAAPVVEPEGRLVLCESVHHVVAPRPEGGAELRWAGGVLPLTGDEFGWLSRLAEGAAPAELGGDEAVAFCRRLAAAGLLVPEPGA
ncbi:MAG TPA: cupin domain-containing protein [Caulobacteraceae bacterium]|nr:cupin domain-containing protein [Caulobacteraceae bacterium]